MRRRQWVREGDLIVLQPWEFQDDKANVKMRYTKTQSLYLSRKGVLPEIVDAFGMAKDAEERFEEETEDEASEIGEESAGSIAEEAPIEDDDIDSFFG